MPKSNKCYLFVFDIETIPDIDVCRSLLNRGEVVDLNCDDTESCIEFLKKNFSSSSNPDKPFIKHAMHKVIVIGCLICEIITCLDGSLNFSIKKVSSYSIDESADEEKGLLDKFLQSLKRRNQPLLVSFNGHSFDLPVLQYRAMKYGLEFPFLVKDLKCRDDGFFKSYYSHRYGSSHLDLLDTLRFFSPSASMKLDDICLVLDLPGKMDISGEKVSDLYFKKEIKKIKEYCEIDVLNTYLLYLRYLLLTGAASKESYNLSCENLLLFIEQNKERNNLVNFANLWTKLKQASYI